MNAQKPFYPTIRVERDFHALHLYQVMRLDPTTRSFIWAARLRIEKADYGHSIEVLRGSLNLGEMSTVKEILSYPMGRGTSREMQL